MASITVLGGWALGGWAGAAGIAITLLDDAWLATWTTVCPDEGLAWSWKINDFMNQKT